MSQEPDTTAEPGSASVDPNSVEGLFVAALGKASPAERTEFLDEACGDDAEMRRRVEALLRAYNDAGSFLEDSPVDLPTGVAPGDNDVRLDFLTPTDKPDRLGMLGHYEIMEVIGRGGMGIVLRALDPKLNRVVAIKALAPELAANPNSRRRFTREAQAAASISHSHIVTIHAVEEEPWPFLVMECVDGQSLQEKLDKIGSLRLTELLRIGRQIAEGLSAAHKQGLIHRDIKPANILLENGVERVKITDFGLARAVDDVAITKTGEVHGTPQFMSPEQARGERVDHRSDLFSLGCVLYAMCAGRPPFRAESLAGVMHRVINDQPRPLLELNPETPPWLIDIVGSLLAKEPEERFGDAAEVAEALEAHLSNIQQPTEGGERRVLRSRPRQRAVPVKAATTERSEMLARVQRIGRVALTIGLVMLIAPWLLIGVGPVIGDGDIMQAGGGLFTFLLPFALLACVGGGVALLVVWVMDPPLHADGGIDHETESGGATSTPWPSAVLMLVAIAGFSFAVTRLFNVQDQFVTLAAIAIAIVLSGVVLAHWVTRRPFRPGFGPAGMVFGLAAFVIGGMAGCEDGWGLLSGIQNELVSGCAFVSGLAALIGSWQLAPVRRRVAAHPPKEEAAAGIRRPATILAWLGVAALSLLLLAPCVLAISWYAAGFAVPPVDEPATDTGSPIDGSALEEWDPLVIAPVATGALTLKMPHGVLSVELRPLDLTSDPPTPHPGTVYSEGGTFEVAAGSYRPVVYDGAFGWLGQPEPAPTAGDAADGGFDTMDAESPMGSASATPFNAVYVLPDIAVEEDTSTTLTVARDFPALAVAEPDWNLGGLYRFKWSSREYLLTRPQAKMVQFLLAAYGGGDPELSASQLWDAFEADPDEELVEAIAIDGGDDFDEFEWLFNDGAHPAWGSLVIVSASGNGYRLANAIELTSNPFVIGGSDPRPFGTAGFGPPTAAPTATIGPTLTVEITPDVSIGDRESQVTVDLRDTGLLVALRRKSSFSGENIGEEETVSQMGPTILRLAGGTYEVLLRDPMFGWQQDRIETVEIAGGTVQTFIVQRDFGEYSDADDQSAGSWRQQFVWNGGTFGLTPSQAACVNLLLRRYADESFTATNEELVAAAQTWWFGPSPFTAEGVFSDIREFDSAGPSEASGSLVVRVADTDEYRLAPAEVGVIQPLIEHAWMGVVITTADGETFSVDSPTEAGYRIPLGDCRVTTTDRLVSWNSGDFSGVHHGADVAQYHLADPGDAIMHKVSRNAAYLRRQADVEFPDDVESVTFTWFPPALTGRGGPMYQHILNREQAECIKILLHALADGEPEMTAEEIEAAAGLEETTFPERFEGLVNVWGGLLLEGEEPGVYRLVPPPDGLVSLEDPAATMDESAPGDQPADDGEGGASQPDQSVTARRISDTTDSALASLDRLIDLADAEHQRVLQLHEAGGVSMAEVLEAEIRLFEARIRRAEAADDESALADLLGEIVSLREARLVEVEELSEQGAVSASAVHTARETLIEARIRLAEATAADEEQLIELLDELVALKEEAVDRMMGLVENGVAGEADLNEAKVELVEVEFRGMIALEDIDEARQRLEELIALREVDLLRVRELVDLGVASESALSRAEEAVVRAKLRLQEFGESLEPVE